MSFKKITDMLLTMVIGSLCIMGIVWYLLDTTSEKKTEKTEISLINNDSKIFSLLPSLSGINTSNVEALLGKPKEVYKNKIYTYVDKYAQYDLLIEDALKSIVVTMKDSNNIENVESLLKTLIPGYTSGLIKEHKVENIKGRIVLKIYNLEDYSKIEIATVDNSKVIEYIKIKY